MSTPHRLATLDYLTEVAKDWTISSFAAAGNGDFALAPHRFELDGHTVRRRRIARRSREATNPLQAAGRTPHPMAWVRSDTVTLLADSPSGPVEFRQEVVELLAVEEDDVVAEVALVVRIPGVPPCLGRFSTGT
jgi:hypothetical protein